SSKVFAASPRRVRYWRRMSEAAAVEDVSSNDRHDLPTRTNPACQRAAGESDLPLSASASSARRSTCPAASARRTFSTDFADASSGLPAPFFVAASEAGWPMRSRPKPSDRTTATRLQVMMTVLFQATTGDFPIFPRPSRYEERNFITEAGAH